VANIKSFPNNQDEYIGAEYVMKWLHGRTSGVFAADSNAAVTAVQNEMAVNLSDGLGWMANSGKDGVVWWIDNEAVNGAKLKLPIDAADSALNRIDRIIVEWKTTNYVDYPEVKVLKGSLSSNPTAPALTNNSTVRQISLARIRVNAGTTAITASMITDERLNASVCGLVTESITIDTSVMQNQFEALLSSIARQLDDLQQGTATALKQRATAVLAGNGWKAGYQTVIVGGVTETNDVFVSVPEAYYEAYTDAGIRCVEQSAGQLKFFSESAPTVDITVGILIIS
jgi:hypothetical protein